MKSLFLTIAASVFVNLLILAQNPPEGYIRFDSSGMARMVMNLDESQFKGSAKEIADSYISANKHWICGSENGNYIYEKTIINPAGNHVSYIQKINNVIVEGSELVISINKRNAISHVYNGYKNGININTTPSISSEQAIIVAKSTFSNPNIVFSKPPQADLIIYNKDSKNNYLVWKCELTPTDNSTWLFYIDASNSDILYKTINCYNYEDGTGSVWNPDPGTFYNDNNIPDNGDLNNDDWEYQSVNLLDLNEPQGGLYYLRGKYAVSADYLSAPDYTVSSNQKVFEFKRADKGFEEVNSYFHIDKLLRYVNGLEFTPTWTSSENMYLYFDPHSGYTSGGGYDPGSGIIKLGNSLSYKDSGEDLSTICHEVGHALHDAFLCGGTAIIASSHEDLSRISEGIAHYFGIESRRRASYNLPNSNSNWTRFTDIMNVVQIPSYMNFQVNWNTNEPPHYPGRVWCSALMDLEYISATEPANGFNLGRDIVTTLQLSALTYITSSASVFDNALALYQADIDINEGLYLRQLIDVFHNRLLFRNENVQNIYGNVTTNSNWNGFKKVNGAIHVTSGKTLTIASNSVIVLDGELVIDQGASLNMGNNVKFIGYSAAHKVVVNGTIGSEVAGMVNSITFILAGPTTQPGYTGGLSLMNATQSVTINNAIFTKTRLIHNGGGLTVNNSTFTDCNKNISYRGNITYSGCTFVKSGLYFENQNNDANAVVTVNNNCSMNGQQFANAIELTGYKKFLIANNSIQNYTNGIRIFNSGLTAPTNQIVNNNSIFNCSNIGLTCYYSYADITMNRIFSNAAGVGLYNASTTKIYGDQYAANTLGTQQIMDNSSYEVLISRSSFPSLFKWNYISDPDNLGGASDPLIYYLPPTSSLISNANVKDNCWGSNFNATQDLYCSTGCSFLWDPTWSPSGKKSGNTYEEAELMFNDALDLLNSGNYADAKNAFQSVVNEHHATVYAESSLKELFRIESITSDDFQGLKEYYLENDSINAAENLTALASYLANKCNEQLGNYQECITWYENMILNAESEEDSIFAVIDLGYLYLLIQNSGLKSVETGNLKQFVPENQNKFEGQRDYLLTLLPGKDMSNQNPIQLKNLAPGSLLQNYPNPFMANTEIWYNIETSANVLITITDQTGRTLKQLKLGFVNKGAHKVDLTSDGLASGIYYYSLVIDGKLSDTKKLTIIK